jgi:hypothetical protein
MRPRRSWLYMVAGLAVALVAVSAIVQSVREGSWSPLVSVSWLLGVVVVTWPGTARCCLPRRRQAR